MILKTTKSIFSHSDELQVLALEKTKFDLVKSKLEGEARLDMINSRCAFLHS